MGEIKSTLDLVMERTRHLSLSDEEKEAQRQKEVQQKTKGLVQRFEDRSLNEEQFRRELDRLQAAYHLSGKGHLRDAILQRLKIGNPADRLLILLERFCQADPSAVQKVFLTCDREMAQVTEAKSQELKGQLQKVYDIGGSAVVANLEKDAAFQQQLEKLREKYTQQLAAQKDAFRIENA